MQASREIRKTISHYEIVFWSTDQSIFHPLHKKLSFIKGQD
ncbi:hypothetical protein SSIN_1485 [Streptococcus sinensis]|uniref:Uncharacterized protein n=1 Tax=Streptococcus sinensis TaxID=176090 RepID=A0A0A0DDJ6_9STRE|nr:hypothetical protein SSIN_1485 [Streptococcus sinensis]